MKITGKTKQLGLIGNPVGHSFSPEIHNFISKEMDLDFTYSVFNVENDYVKDAIGGVRALNIRGINVTAPHKTAVIKYLDEISDDAKMFNSVNTIVNNNGILTGYNTDSEGFYLSLINNGISVKDKDILIIGCGGVVVPTAVGLIKASPKSLTIINRTASKAKDIAQKLTQTTGFNVLTDMQLDSYDIIINTTSVGLGKESDELPWDSIDGVDLTSFLHDGMSAVDMIYNPERTYFLQLAKSRGAKILNGLDMLIYQGVLAYELFADVKLPNNMANLIKKEVFGR